MLRWQNGVQRNVQAVLRTAVLAIDGQGGQARARRNAWAGASELSNRRREREEVEAYLARLSPTRSGQVGLRAVSSGTGR